MKREKTSPVERKHEALSVPVMLAVALVAILAALSIAAADQSDGSEELSKYEEWNRCGDGMFWCYDREDKILKFRGEGYMYDYDFDQQHRERYPPWISCEFDTVYWGDGGSTLKSIGKWAFANREIKDFVFYDKNLEFIDERAFFNSTIEKIRADDGSSLRLYELKSIGVYAFESNSKAESFDLTFAPNLERIEDNAFGRCFALKSVVLPDSVEFIGKCAFIGCGELEKVIIPSKLKEIGDNAFSSDAKLRDIQLPEGLQTIGKYAFSHTKCLEDLILPKSLRTLDVSSFVESGITTATVLGNTEIKNFSFRSCANLETINILGGATLVYDAIVDCPSLKTIYLTPAANVEGCAIHDCGSLKDVIYISEEKWNWWTTDFTPIDTWQTVTIHSPYNASKGAFDNFKSQGGFEYETYGYDDGTFYWYFAGEMMVLDSTLTGTPGDAPYNPVATWQSDPMYEKVTLLRLGSSINLITAAGFMNSNLVCVDCSGAESLTSIRDSAFMNCASLTEVILPGKLTEIGDRAFKGCSNLQIIEFKGSENGFQHIGEAAFDLVDQGKTMCYVISNDNILDGVFDQGIKDSNTDLCYVDVGGLEMMWSIEGDTLYIYPLDRRSDGTMPDYSPSVRPLWESDPLWPDVVKIELVSGVRSIGDYAFFNCHDIGVFSVHASSDCPLISIGSYAFRQENETRGNALAIMIDNWHYVETIKDHAFAGSFSAVSNYFDKAIRLKTIGDSAFEGCYHLTSVLIPGSVRNIGDNAFANTRLVSITIMQEPSRLEMGSNVFANVPGVIDVYSWNNQWDHMLDALGTDPSAFRYHSIESFDDDGDRIDYGDIAKPIAAIIVFVVTAIFIAFVARRD